MTEPDRVVFIVDDDASLRESLKDLIGSVRLCVEVEESIAVTLLGKGLYLRIHFVPCLP